MPIETRVSGPEKYKCVICKDKQCVDEQQTRVPVQHNTDNSGRITRSMSKILNIMNEFAIYEVYRCMPLLGDEKNNVPEWDVHIVHYSVVYTGN